MGIRAAFRRLARIEPVWWLSLVIAATAATLYLVSVRHYGPVHGPEIGWWGLALMVLVTERWSVELEFRRTSHSFSLTDIPFTLALVFATGTHAFVAIMAGTFVALLLRRLPAVKFVFNLAQFALVSCVMIIVVQLASGLDPGFGWLTWAALLAATPLGGVLTIAAILAAMMLTDGRVSRDAGAPDVRPGPPRHGHEHGAGARLRHPLDRAARGHAAAADPDPDRLRRLPRVRQASARATRRSRSSTRPTAPSPSRAEVAVALEGLLERDARGLPRRAGRGHPLRRRRWRVAAHQPRPGHRPRGDGARRRVRRHGPARVRRGLRRGGGADGAVPGAARPLPARTRTSATACSASCAARIA